MLTDEVWAQLDHGAARLPPAQLRRVYLALAALVIAAQLGMVTWLSGALVPRLSIDPSRSTAHMDYYVGFAYIVPLRNDGWTSVTVTGWGASQPGFERVVKPSERPGFTLRPGEVRDIEINYRLTDCATVPEDPRSLPVRVDRFWGSLTVTVGLPERSLEYGREACRPRG